MFRFRLSEGPRKNLLLQHIRGSGYWRFVSVSNKHRVEVEPILHAADAVRLFAQLLGSTLVIRRFPELHVPFIPVGPNPGQLDRNSVLRIKSDKGKRIVSSFMGEDHAILLRQQKRYFLQSGVDILEYPEKDRLVLFNGGAIRCQDDKEELAVTYEPESNLIYLDRSRFSLRLLVRLGYYLLSDWITFKVDRRFFLPGLPIHFGFSAIELVGDLPKKPSRKKKQAKVASSRALKNKERSSESGKSKSVFAAEDQELAELTRELEKLIAEILGPNSGSS